MLEAFCLSILIDFCRQGNASIGNVRITAYQKVTVLHKFLNSLLDLAIP